jgi:quercetin dioxygenase-like cupin family protein
MRMDVIKAASRATTTANPDYFTGVVWQEPVIEAPAPARVRALKVTFAPGARTAWHTHPLGQTLLVLSGVGFVQKQGEPACAILPGDTVWIAPGEKHWHGASGHAAMTHLAIQEALDGSNVDWLEKVSDADYAAATLS